MKNEPRGRILPPKFRQVIDVDHFRKFTLKERVMILFGFNVVCRLSILTVNKPGDFQPQMRVDLTKEVDPIKV